MLDFLIDFFNTGTLQVVMKMFQRQEECKDIRFVPIFGSVWINFNVEMARKNRIMFA